MPHMCTRCKNVFDDGVDILRGCPVCGQKKFLFVKSDAQIKEVKRKLNASEIGGPYEPWPENDDKLSDILKSPGKKRTDPDRVHPDNIHPDNIHLDNVPQSKLAGDVRAKEGDIPMGETRQSTKILESVRQNDDDMVESIRMSEPGTYELNLPTLFERDELVMSVKDGTYLIDLSSAFKKYKKD